MQGSVRGWLLIACLGWSLAVQAAIPQTPRFRSLKVDDGLPSSHVNQIVQDAAGYLWFGTKDGLARFDGTGFKVFRHDPGDVDSLPGNGISALHIDGRGRLWIGIDGHGVVRLDPGKSRFVRVAPEKKPFPREDVWAIESTADGSTWFGTYSKGLHRLSATGKWRHFSATGAPPDRLPSDEVLALAVDGQGNLFAGTGQGLVRWTGQRFEPEPTGDLALPRVVMLESDEEGLWVGTTQGLRLRSQAGVWQTLPWQSGVAHPVFATRRDRFGVRWLATSAGLMEVSDASLGQVHAGAPHGFAFGKTLLEDAEGGMWVAQRGYGVLYSPASWRKFSTFGPNSGSARTSVARVKAFAESRNGDVWLAGDGGLDRFQIDTGRISAVLPAQAMAGCTAASLLEGSNGSVWIGCTDGLIRFDPRTGAVKRWSARSQKDALPRGVIASIVEDKDGLVWISTGDGIQWRDGHGRVVRALDARQLNPATGVDSRALVGPDGNIWFDTAAGIKRWRADVSRAEAIPGLPAVQARAFGFGRSVAWILRDQSLEGYRWDGQRMVLDRRFVGTNVELVGVSGLLVDRRERLWFTTARGLVRLDPTDASLRVYDTEDGLPSPELDASAPLVTREGIVFASTPTDFVVFDPGSFATSAVVPRVQLETISIRRNDQVLELPNSTARVLLQADDRDLRITARIASMSEPGSRKFRFRLNGYERDWVEDEEGERVFTRLEHGTYEMEVCAATADGVWSQPRRLQIVVSPHWWQTKWAMGAFACLLVAAILSLRAAYRARLRGIHEKQILEQRRVLAEQASQAKTRFLADLGHEIRTPMTGVLGMAELMRADASDARQCARIEAIQSAGQHLLVLLNDALDLARIEAGRLELQDVAFDLPALIADACALLRPQAEARGLDLALHLAPDLPRGVRGDPVRLRQILHNLGGNAVKFTARGGIRVRAFVDAHRIRVEVADTGPGMDAAQLARLFGRFEQAEGAHTWAHFGGSGLGLAICRELAQAMGGDIEVDSVVGRGSCFRVTLPLAAVALPEADAPVALRVREPSLASAHVLVVEDDALVAEVVCALFAHLGHTSRRAAHAMDALTTAAGDRFDLAVVDLDLPGVDGFELTRLLRTQGFTAPIVALTARADAEAEALARAAGMAGFLRKPVTGDMLAAAVARHARPIAAVAEPA